MSTETRQMLRQPCSTCGAKPGEPCRTASGQRAESHVPRWHAAVRARKVEATGPAQTTNGTTSKRPEGKSRADAAGRGDGT